MLTTDRVDSQNPVWPLRAMDQQDKHQENGSNLQNLHPYTDTQLAWNCSLWEFMPENFAPATGLCHYSAGRTRLSLRVTSSRGWHVSSSHSLPPTTFSSCCYDYYLARVGIQNVLQFTESLSLFLHSAVPFCFLVPLSIINISEYQFYHNHKGRYQMHWVYIYFLTSIILVWGDCIWWIDFITSY